MAAWFWWTMSHCTLIHVCNNQKILWNSDSQVGLTTVNIELFHHRPLRFICNAVCAWILLKLGDKKKHTMGRARARERERNSYFYRRTGSRSFGFVCLWYMHSLNSVIDGFNISNNNNIDTFVSFMPEKVKLFREIFARVSVCVYSWFTT